MNPVANKAHLEFYSEHQIFPVNYDLSDLDAHLQRRRALYNKLGLLPLTFRDSNVLEVAAGTGQNSLYLAQTKPSKLVLLEPNKIGLESIYNNYKTFNRSHTSPEIISQTLEEFNPIGNFDIVICENWLGTSAHEQTLLIKLGNMVANHGMLVLTTLSPVGFVPNLLRRFLSLYLAPINANFQKRTELLISAFANHLDTLPEMTRNKTDWVQDNMLNPAYFGLCLSLPQVIGILGKQFDVSGTSPSFMEDWRWFKSLHGSQHEYNEHFLSEYWKKSHNFLDHREKPFALKKNHIKNMCLEENAINLLHLIAMHEDNYFREEDVTKLEHAIIAALNEFIFYIPKSFSAAIAGLNQIKQLIQSPNMITVESVSKLNDFKALFGRETIYVSLMKVK
jgi:2-polyprenyl-3-methyl-5-hydroxy-6-metoxy-1,4-benzoquinol methylase